MTDRWTMASAKTVIRAGGFDPTQEARRMRRFAVSHGWGATVRYTVDGRGIIVRDVVTYPDGVTVEDEATFRNMSALRRWAGY